jgi:methanethiol S-methyltransferase
MTTQADGIVERPAWGLAYAWSGVAIMSIFWISFVIFLSSPKKILNYWPLPTVDHGGCLETTWLAAIVNSGLILLFGLQHSVMARPWFKQTVMGRIPTALERCTYVHMANVALFALIVLWQPIPAVVWDVGNGIWREALWAVFTAGWIILFLGAWSFGIFELLGLTQMRAWTNGKPARSLELKTGWIYRWLRHPMYVGVLLGVWATPRMTAGHLLLATGLSAYVLIGMRYEERDLSAQYGSQYRRWRAST